MSAFSTYPKCLNPSCTYQQHSSPSFRTNQIYGGHCCYRCYEFHVDPNCYKGKRAKKHGPCCEKIPFEGEVANSTCYSFADPLLCLEASSLKAAERHGHHCEQQTTVNKSTTSVPIDNKMDQLDQYQTVPIPTATITTSNPSKKRRSALKKTDSLVAPTEPRA